MLDFSKNYFELFGIPVSFDLDADALAEHYRELQRRVHPDRYASASQRERRLAVQGSGHINQAFETLKRPLSRARYMLSLYGMDLAARQETTSDPQFLMEQMELRETLAEARFQDDPYAVISGIMEHLRKQRDALITAFPTQFEEAKASSLEAARDNVCKLQFLEKLGHEAESLEAELDDEIG